MAGPEKKQKAEKPQSEDTKHKGKKDKLRKVLSTTSRGSKKGKKLDSSTAGGSTNSRGGTGSKQRGSKSKAVKPLIEAEVEGAQTLQVNKPKRAHRAGSKKLSTGSEVVREAGEESEEEAEEEQGPKPGTGNSGEADEDIWDKHGPPTPPTTGVSYYGFDPSTTKVPYHVGSTGDIINEIPADSDPDIPTTESNRSSVSIPCDLDDCGDFPYEEDSDEEEDRTIRERFPGVFTQHEPWLTPVSEEGPAPEQAPEQQYPILASEDGHVILAAEDNDVPDFKFTHMDMSCRGLHDVTIIQHFTSLRSLTLAINFIQTLKDLDCMVNLIKLNVSENEITEFLDIHGRALLPIQEINFSRNQVSKILKLNPFWALTIVDLSYNRLTVVDNFQDCQYLRVLNLSHNAIVEIRNLVCPNLIILMLKANELEDISCLEYCPNVRYLNISYNKIQSLSSLRSMPRLMELRCSDNRIADLLELEALKSLLNLSHLRINPNTCNEVGMSRGMLIFMFPQVCYLDTHYVYPEEILEARNTFNPSYQKLAFESHADAMMEKATASANIMFSSFCNLYPIPPMIFLVGSSKSDANRLALYLKQQLPYNVMLGGVHSTATTIEGGNLNVDIPVSLESFMELKKRGDLLSTSNILGRLCGFSVTQIIKASERRALLVGTIPLATAICLKQWNLNPKLILVLPSGPPRFNVDEFIESEIAKEKEQQANPEEETLAEEPVHEHLIKFAERSVVHGSHKQPVINEVQPVMHSILKAKTAHDENNWDMPNFSTMSMAVGLAEHAEDKTPEELSNTSAEKGADESTQANLDVPSMAIVRLSTIGFPEDIPLIVSDTQLKVEEVDENVKKLEEIESPAATVGENTKSPNTDLEEEEEELINVKYAPPFTVTNRLRRLQRLMTTLLTQTESNEAELHSQFFPNVNMEIPSVEPAMGELVDWQATILRNQFYNDLLNTDQSYFMVIEPLLGLDEISVHPAVFRSSLVQKTPINSATSNPEDLESFELLVRKVESKTHGIEETESEELLVAEDAGIQEEAPAIEVNIGSRPACASKPTDATSSASKASCASAEGSYHSMMDMKAGGDAVEDMDTEAKLNFEEGEKAVLRRSIYGEIINTGDEDDDDAESEDMDASACPDARHRFKHRDALEKAIMKIREDYLSYHLENSGFFATVLDTTDFEISRVEFYEFARDTLRKHKEIQTKFELMDSHAGKNTLDKPHFIREKVRHCKAQAKEWAKGYHHPLQHMRNLKTDCVDSGVLFEKQRCPTNLMDPSFPRPLGTAKVLQLKHVAARRQEQEDEIARLRQASKLAQDSKANKKCRKNSKVGEGDAGEAKTGESCSYESIGQNESEVK